MTKRDLAITSNAIRYYVNRSMDTSQFTIDFVERIADSLLEARDEELETWKRATEGDVENVLEIMRPEICDYSLLESLKRELEGLDA